MYPQNISETDIHHSIVAKKGFKPLIHKKLKKHIPHSHVDKYKKKKYFISKKHQYLMEDLERSNEVFNIYCFTYEYLNIFRHILTNTIFPIQLESVNFKKLSNTQTYFKLNLRLYLIPNQTETFYCNQIVSFFYME